MTAPALATRRLDLRPPRPGDAEAFASLCGRAFEVARWLTSPAWPYREGDAEAYIARAVASDRLAEEAVFAVTLGGPVIGCVSVTAPGDLASAPELPTLGYWLGQPFQGFGYATEAATAALAWAFEAHDCTRIGARVFADNHRSRRLLARLGFVETGHMRRFARPLGREVDNVLLICDRPRFQAAARDRRAGAEPARPRAH